MLKKTPVGLFFAFLHNREKNENKIDGRKQKFHDGCFT